MRSAVIIIDVQCGLFDAEPRPFEADEVLERINNVTGRARTAGVPVIFVQSEHPAFLPFGSEEWQLHPAVTVHDGDIRIRKTMANAFLGTDLEATLRRCDARNLIICGYSTEFCVDSTLRYASALGFHIQLVADGHTTHDKEHLPARQIREHHNITLGHGPTVTVVPAAELEIAG
ncbi:MAG TPA: cysteine hydrolase family protein [Candidatus Kapabacteria bacterium]|nr:cysteine hydrolase family protein [Candidatus Kapabacteria bacterium]